MNRVMTCMFIVALLLGACAKTSASPAATEAESVPAQANSNSAPLTEAAPASTEAAPQSDRSAALTEIEGTVQARPVQTGDFAPASPGATLLAGGEVRTGEDGKARLDLAPEGTIVRVVPNSSFTLTDLSSDGTKPSSKIQLFFGQIFILLKGGELKVETPSGVAAVRGSLLSIKFDPDKKTVTATCLEGHCSLSNAEGTIELEDGQAADIIDGDLSDEARWMTPDEITEWTDDIPELNEFIDELPDIPEEAPPTDEPVPTDPPAYEPPP